jgi:putative phage-type endonuclease
VTFEEDRRSGLGSTDSPAILGLSPWKSAHDVWQEKTGRGEAREVNLPMFLGTHLEKAIGELFTANTGIPVVRDEGFYRHPDGVLTCHIDFRTETGGVVEAKTSRSKKGWGPSFSDIVPRNYWTQVQHQMAVLGLDTVDLAVLFGHDEFRIMRIARHDAFIDSLVQDMGKWWADYVLTDTPPPPDGSDASGRWLRESYPTEQTGELVPATPEVQRLVEDLLVVRNTMASLQRSDEVIKQELMDIIKERPGMYGSNFKITWKQNKSSVKVNYPAVLDQLRSVVDKSIIEHLVSANTEIRSGARPFIVEEIVDE